MTRYWLAGVALVLGYVVSLAFRSELPLAMAAESCCVECAEAATTATPAPPPSTETQPASHFVHFALDGLTCKSGDNDFHIKRIEFQYKGEGIIDSHIVQLATLAGQSENHEAAETLKKVLSILENVASKKEISISTCGTPVAVPAMQPVCPSGAAPCGWVPVAAPAPAMMPATCTTPCTPASSLSSEGKYEATPATAPLPPSPALEAEEIDVNVPDC